MFTNAGMVQFKDYFTGIEKPNFLRAATSQKCVRAGGKHNDLENVGYTMRHHTFFEMLGNFSFGDYFKEHAIEYAWNFLTKEVGLDRNKLYVTIYHDDDEAHRYWRKIAGLSDDRIIRIASDDNFWAMGDTGPCGPCSEIFYDHGDKIWGGLPGTPEQDGDRYVEIWNLVFMQFEQLNDGTRRSLPKPSIDTGMGLERISAVLQGVCDNYDTDTFRALINATKQISSTIGSAGGESASYKVIADHLRSSSFLLADGVSPSNEGRGYVLRRIMRRAMRHAHLLGCREALLYRLVPALVSEMGNSYPELKRAQALIESTLRDEEDRFRETLDKGMKLLETSAANLSKGSTLSGEIAFKLYDTFGFPLDLTQDILKSRGINVNEKGFAEEMTKQRERAKAAWRGSGEVATEKLWFDLQAEFGDTKFVGYEAEKAEAKVLAIIPTSQPNEALVLLDKTPFYGESGGQVGDVGILKVGNTTYEVLDTKKYLGSLYIHRIKLTGELKEGAIVTAEVDSKRRDMIRANHSATHLLHKALRDVLGHHVTQKGSLVAEDRLRFDFAHPKALQPAELAEIEKRVNQMILMNQPATVALKSPKQAIEEGAMALFGEKYGEEVRVVAMGDSTELCGGTHVKFTGEIGLFKIITEEAIAAGIRRIEAITGLKVLERLDNKEQLLRLLMDRLKSSEEQLLPRINAILVSEKQLEKEVSTLRIEAALSSGWQEEEIVGVKLVIKQAHGIPAKELRDVVDRIRAKSKAGIIAIFSEHEGKINLSIGVDDSLKGKIPAGELIKGAAEAINGSGGGRPEFAQAGGTNVGGVDKAAANIRQTLQAKV
jgi:alanyl-tRNA synthetase